MVKRLLLLRHAKSGWDVPVARDYDRPINERGKLASAAMGAYIRDRDIAVDAVVASPAVRVSETLDHFLPAAGLERLEAHWDRRIYLASAASLIECVQDLPESADNVLMSGHNPGLEDLILDLVPDDGKNADRDAVEQGFPTGALAMIEFDADAWRNVDVGMGRLVGFTRPRDIDPALAGEDGD